MSPSPPPWSGCNTTPTGQGQRHPKRIERRAQSQVEGQDRVDTLRRRPARVCHAGFLGPGENGRLHAQTVEANCRTDALRRSRSASPAANSSCWRSPVAATTSTSLKRTGAPVGHTVVEEGTVLHMRYAAIPKNSRSPNIGALLIHYLMSAPKAKSCSGASTAWTCTYSPARRPNESSTLCAPPKARSSSTRRNGWRRSKNYAAIQKELEGILRRRRQVGIRALE